MVVVVPSRCLHLQGGLRTIEAKALQSEARSLGNADFKFFLYRLSVQSIEILVPFFQTNSSNM